jgi:hypothetical protein
MQLDHIERARILVQGIDVLRDDGACGNAHLQGREQVRRPGRDHAKRLAVSGSRRDALIPLRGATFLQWTLSRTSELA